MGLASSDAVTLSLEDAAAGGAGTGAAQLFVNTPGAADQRRPAITKKVARALRWEGHWDHGVSANRHADNCADGVLGRHNLLGLLFVLLLTLGPLGTDQMLRYQGTGN